MAKKKSKRHMDLNSHPMWKRHAERSPEWLRGNRGRRSRNSA
ncbi:hypothetical protein SPURM210S_00371 [Streptomyces purpurascens]